MAVPQYRFLNDLKTKFEQFCTEDVPQVMPCSEADIATLEQQLSVKLPQAYREFLLWMGRGGGFLLKTCRFDILPRINDEARQLVKRKRPRLVLPDDAFVFCSDISEQFWFFRPREGNNPKVYIFIDQEQQAYIRGQQTIDEFPPEWAFLFDDPKEEFGIFSPSFTAYLNYELDIYIQVKQKAKAREQERLKRQ